MAGVLPSGLTESLVQPTLDDILVVQIDGEATVKKVKSTTVGLNKLEPFTGIESFDGLSINADTTLFDVGALKGWIVDDTTNTDIPVPTKVVYAGGTGITVTNILTHPVTYIGINSVGTILQFTTPLTPTQRRGILELGVIVHSNNLNINGINNLPVSGLDANAQLHDFMVGVGTINTGGNLISPNGTDLKIDKSAGGMLKYGSNFVPNPLDPHNTVLPVLTPATVRYRLQDGTEYPDTTNIDPNNYDLGGVLTVTPNSKYTIQRVAIFSSNIIRIQYGQNLYNTMALAQIELESETFVVENNIDENALLIAFIIIKQGTVDLSSTANVKIINANRLGTLSGAGGTSVTSMQDAYDNSLAPQIVTSNLGSVMIQEGTNAGGEIDLLDLRDFTGTSTFTVIQEGNPYIKDGSEGINKYLLSDVNGKGIWSYLTYPIVTKVADYPSVIGDNTILVDATGGITTITLPLAASSTGSKQSIKKVDVTANNVVVDGNGSNIDGQLTQTLTTQYEVITVHCDGTDWYIV